MCKHLDSKLTDMLENSVPPAELDRITSFRTACAKHNKQAGVMVLGFNSYCVVCGKDFLAWN